ncbi:MAG: peroxiredoxin-like family protein [Acidobacteriaceae bacterium]
MGRLQDQLDQITRQTRQLLPPKLMEPGERDIAELFASGIEKRILPVGGMAPEFSLQDNNGRMVRSTDLLALGPLIVTFFRGRWCPYCMAELEAWRDFYPTVRARGALLVAISPQTIHQNDLLIQKYLPRFPVLSDVGSAVAESFGLAYTLSEHRQKAYRSTMVNLPFLNGDPSWRLPLPATFLVQPDGFIAFAQAHADFRVRPEPEDVLAVLDHENSRNLKI